MDEAVIFTKLDATSRSELAAHAVRVRRSVPQREWVCKEGWGTAIGAWRVLASASANGQSGHAAVVLSGAACSIASNAAAACTRASKIAIAAMPGRLLSI